MSQQLTSALTDKTRGKSLEGGGESEREGLFIFPLVSDGMDG